MRGGDCTAAHPGELVTSALSFLIGPRAEKCPKSDHFATLLNILHISF